MTLNGIAMIVYALLTLAVGIVCYIWGRSDERDEQMRRASETFGYGRGDSE